MARQREKSWKLRLLLASAGTSALAALALAAPAVGVPPTLGLSATNATVGGQIEATAQLSESPGATGEISFEVFGPGDASCSGPALTPAPPSKQVTGEGSYSTTFTPPGAGIYHWSAHYSGDLGEGGVDEPADAVCAAASEVGKASPGLSAAASGAVVGGTIHDAVSLTGGFSPSGSVTFKVYGPGDGACATALETYVVAVSGAGATSPDFTAPHAGAYRWTASYPGDANNEGAAACGAPGQTSEVTKATPGLAGAATSTVTVGSPINDSATLSGSFAATGQLVFQAFGPDDAACAGAPAYQEAVPISGDGTYAPAGFSPPISGLYRWTVAYAGDADNAAAGLGCNAPNQASAVGKVAVTLAATATGTMIGGTISATATLAGGANPGGELTFRAFPPGDTSCAGPPAFTSRATVAGDGSYASGPLSPTAIGEFRWTVAYSGDPNHKEASAGCGAAVSPVAVAVPTLFGSVRRQARVGAPFKMTVALVGGHEPAGTITFKIYGPGGTDCNKPLAVDIVPVGAGGNIKSDPFKAPRPGRYRFVAAYSGDAANAPAAQPCDTTGQLVQVEKATPSVKPRGRLLNRRRLSIRALLSGAASPSGVVLFRLYRPGDRGCARTPAFSGGTTVKSNGVHALAEYLATRPGLYRLVVSYSGDPRNRPFPANCRGAQPIRIR